MSRLGSSLADLKEALDMSCKVEVPTMVDSSTNQLYLHQMYECVCDYVTESYCFGSIYCYTYDKVTYSILNHN